MAKVSRDKKTKEPSKTTDATKENEGDEAKEKRRKRRPEYTSHSTHVKKFIEKQNDMRITMAEKRRKRGEKTRIDKTKVTFDREAISIVSKIIDRYVIEVSRQCRIHSDIKRKDITKDHRLSPEIATVAIKEVMKQFLPEKDVKGIMSRCSSHFGDLMEKLHAREIVAKDAKAERDAKTEASDKDSDDEPKPTKKTRKHV